MKNMIYAYCRVSTPRQKLERQITNIHQKFPDAVIYKEKYTGTTLDRPEWLKLQRRLKAGDTVVFDEISRMSRSAAEGFNLYENLFQAGIHLVFLKEPHLDSEVYRQALENHINLTGSDVDVILKGINEYLMLLAKRQIEIAFQTAQHEVDYLHQRVSEGVRKAQDAGKQIGRITGTRIETRKAKEAKKIILRCSKDFDGQNTDLELLKMTGLSRNTYYKYKKELAQG